MNEYLTVIMKEMCSRVGADFDKIDTTSPFWFHEFTWTTDEERDYILWLADYLMNNSKARKDLMVRPRKSKKAVTDFAIHFTYNYGWKTKIDTKL